MVSTIQDRVKEIQQKIASCLSLKTSQLVFEFNEMPDYVDLFTIQWKLKGTTEIHQSYFRAFNMMDALDKFYYGRSINSIIIYSITLNPIA